MKNNKSILILGDGLLGSELVKQTGWNYVSRKEHIDFTKPETYEYLINTFDVIINCIAHTDTYGKDRQKHWDVNYKGVADLVDICNKHNKKLIHISSDYLYTYSKSNATEKDVPVHCSNWYGYTKLLAEPFKYDEAWMNQIGNFDYVSVIANLITKLVKKDCSGIYNVGTKVKSMYELAMRTKPDVKPIDKLINNSTPKNLTMSIKKCEDVING